MCSFRTQPRVKVAWDEKENGMDGNHGREWCLTGVQLVFNLHDHLTMDDIAFR